MPTPELQLQDFSFSELFQADGLKRLDSAFLSYLKVSNANLEQQLIAYRTNEAALSALEISELLIACAHVLEEFLAKLFNIEEALAIN